MKEIILDLGVISNELILAGKLQLKKLQKKKPEKKFRLRRGLNPCLPDSIPSTLLRMLPFVSVLTSNTIFGNDNISGTYNIK